VSLEPISLPNVAPKFVETLQTVSLERQATSSSESISLPLIYDANGDSFIVTIEEGPSFVKYSTSKNSLIVDLSEVAEDSNETISIKLEDSGKQTTLYVLSLELKVSEEVVESLEISLPNSTAEENDT